MNNCSVNFLEQVGSLNHYILCHNLGMRLLEMAINVDTKLFGVVLVGKLVDKRLRLI